MEAAINSLLDDPNVKGIVVNVREDMEHNRAGEALRRCEESFRSIFQGSPIGIELYDADGRLLTVNSACLDIFGVSNVAKVEGFRLLEDPNVIDEAKEKLRKGETVRYEAPFDFEKVKKNKLYDTSKSGVILIDVLITPLDPKGKESSGGYLVQVQDISERKQVEEALRTSEEKYRGLVEDTHIGISASDLEGKFTFANRALCEILGYSEGELLGKHFSDFIHPDDREGILRVFQVTSVSPREVADLEFRVINKKGDIMHVYASSTYIGHTGELAESVSIITDITERKQLEQALRESETKYKDLADSLPQTIFELDEKGNFTFANRYGFQSYGYSPEDIDKGWNVLQLFIPEDQERVAENIRRIIAGENISGQEYTVIRRDGSTFPVMVFLSPIIREDKTIGLRGIVIDMTERKQAEAQLLAYQKELRSLHSQLSLTEERQRRRIATEVHDRFSQTLAVCSMKLGVLIDSAPSAPFAEPLVEIQALIKQLMKEARSLTFELSSPLLYELGLEAAVEQLTEEIQEKYGVLSNFEGDRQPKPLDDDVSVLLFQAVRELLINVSKHAQARNVTVSIKKQENSIRITVEDDGAGFDTARIISSTKRTKGFGLFSIHERLHFVGGHIKVESECGRGTRVTLMAPLKR